jgi:ketosteroid isomerase-like protein
MSQEDVQIVREVAKAFNAGDTERVLSAMDPRVEFHSAFDQKTYRGLAGLRQYQEDLDAAWEDWHTENDSFRKAPDSRVLHLYRIAGRGKGSGVSIEQDIAILWELRDGKLLDGHVFLDQGEALEAAGLSE